MVELIGSVEKKLEIVKVGRKLRVEGKKENRRRKRKWKKGTYSLGRENENNESGGLPGSSGGCGNQFGKYRNRPKFKYLGTTRNKYQKSRIIY